MRLSSLAIEAATERFEIKAEVFRDLDRILRDDAILATNTSSISITQDRGRRRSVLSRSSGCTSSIRCR